MAVHRYYRNLVNRERKRLRSHYFSSKVSQLKKHQTICLVAQAQKITGMQSSTDPGSVYSQLKFDQVAGKANLEEIANRINEAFLRPMQNYQLPSYNPFNNDQFDPDLETFQPTNRILHLQPSKKIKSTEATVSLTGFSKRLLKYLPNQSVKFSTLPSTSRNYHRIGNMLT